MPGKRTFLRPIIRVIGPSIAYVELTQDQYSLIDSQDAELVGQYNWFAQYKPKSNKYIAGRGFNSGEGRSNWKRMCLHNELLTPREGFEPDHKNRNSLDNRRSNLRYATRNQNQENTSSTNKTGFKGVRKHPSGRYEARLGTPPNRISLGTFASPEEAYEARSRKAKELHGIFAYRQ